MYRFRLGVYDGEGIVVSLSFRFVLTERGVSLFHVKSTAAERQIRVPPCTERFNVI